jgi:hypothetical protein
MAEATLKITGVTQDPADPSGFVLHLSRTLTPNERKTLPELLKDGAFSPDEVTGPDSVTIRWAHKHLFTDPTIRARLKGIVAEAEMVAHHQLRVQHTATAPRMG